MKALQSFEIWGTADPTTQHNIQKDFCIEQYHCENLKSHTVCMLRHVFTLHQGSQTQNTWAKWIILKFKAQHMSF
jgi:hypothetical protein